MIHLQNVHNCSSHLCGGDRILNIASEQFFGDEYSSHLASLSMIFSIMSNEQIQSSSMPHSEAVALVSKAEAIMLCTQALVRQALALEESPPGQFCE